MRNLFAFTIVVAGCSSSAAPASPGPSNEAVVSTWAKVFCERLFECAPGEKERRFRGTDAESCTRIQIDSMTRALNAPGAPKTLSKLQKCADELRPLSCQNVMDVLITYDFVPAPDCMTLDPGDLPVGAACVYGSQCAGGKCSPADGTCGRCVAVAADGEPCTVTTFAPDICDSAHGSVCVRGQCKKAPRIGEPCVETCAGYSTCHAVMHSCVPLQQTRGAVCEPSSGDCDTVGRSLVCSNTTSSCERMEIVKEGDICGLGVPSGGWADCGEGLLCDMSKPTTSNPVSGRCVRATVGKLGDACVPLGTYFQHGCEAETRCVGGVCVVDDPIACK
jgi:hypothetical protein